MKPQQQQHYLNYRKKKLQLKYNYAQNPSALQNHQQEIISKWQGLSLLQKGFLIHAQFLTSATAGNSIIDPTISNILKVWRTAFVFQREYGIPTNLAEIAEQDFINEMKTWNFRYTVLSNCLGINCAFFLYNSRIFSRFRPLYRAVFVSLIGFQLRNYIFQRGFNRIYYPIEPLFQEYRDDYQAFKREGLLLKQGGSQMNIEAKTSGQSIIGKLKEMSQRSKEAEKEMYEVQDKGGNKVIIKADKGLEQIQTELEESRGEFEKKYVTLKDCGAGGKEEYQRLLDEYCRLEYGAVDQQAENEMYMIGDFQQQLRRMYEQERRPFASIRLSSRLNNP